MEAENQSGKRREFLAVIGGAAATGIAGCSLNDSDSDEFPTGAIEFIVPFGPGGGFDTYTRLMADHITNNISVNVNVTNVEGGGGIVGLNQVRDAEPDGYTNMILWLDGFAQQQVLEDGDFDLRDMTFYPQVASPIETFNVGTDSGIETWDNYVEGVQNGELTFGVAGSPTAGGSVLPVLVGEMADLYSVENVAENLVTYNERGEMINAVRRDEVQVVVGTQGSTAQYIESGDLRRITTFATGDEKQTDIAGEVQNLQEVGVLDEEQFQQIQDFGGGNRAFGGPPEMPEDRADIIRDAITETLQSDAFLDAAAEADREVAYEDSEGVRRKVNNLIELWEENKSLIEDIQQIASSS